MKRIFLFSIAIAMTILVNAQVKFIYDLDEPHLIGSWGVYEASSSNLPVKFVFGEKESFIYEPGWYGDLTSSKYLAFIIGGSTTGKFTLHLVGGTAYGMNDFEHGWRNYVVHSFNGSELEISDYDETFTLKLRKDYEPSSQIPNEIEYVDLGLSVLWATSNLGASSPYDTGDYYAWGETTPNKTVYNETSYQVDWYSMPYDISGTQYDPVHVKLGNGWHLPTFSDFLELINECQWEYSETHHGYYITGTNGNQIFFLLAGGKEEDYNVGYLQDVFWLQGFYMSSSKGGDLYNNYLLIDSEKHGMYQYLATRGQTVRPVKANTNKAPIISKDPEGCVNVYNLSGQLEFINVPIQDLQEVLPKGIHIINGQKLLIE